MSLIHYIVWYKTPLLLLTCLTSVVSCFNVSWQLSLPTSQPDSLPFVIGMISLGKSTFTRHFHVNFSSTTNVALPNVGCYVCFCVCTYFFPVEFYGQNLATVWFWKVMRYFNAIRPSLIERNNSKACKWIVRVLTFRKIHFSIYLNLFCETMPKIFCLSPRERCRVMKNWRCLFERVSTILQDKNVMRTGNLSWL